MVTSACLSMYPNKPSLPVGASDPNISGTVSLIAIAAIVALGGRKEGLSFTAIIWNHYLLISTMVHTFTLSPLPPAFLLGLRDSSSTLRCPPPHPRTDGRRAGCLRGGAHQAREV